MMKKTILLSLFVIGLFFGIAVGSNVTAINGDNIFYEKTKLTASDGEIGDNFGCSVSIDGDYIIVGARYDDDKGEYSGSAYIFKKTASTWVQQDKLLPLDLNADSNFGFSVDIDGEYAVVGATEHHSSRTGAAYIYKNTGEGWVQQTKLSPSDGTSADSFGYSVAIDDDTVLVGSIYDDDNGENSGSAYVFKRNSNTWTQQDKLLPSDGKAYDFFGYSVSLEGDAALIGATSTGYYNEDRIGSAYVFKRNGDSWNQQAILTASDGASRDAFGRSVSINGGRLVVGSSSIPSAVYIFKQTDSSSWSQEPKILEGRIGYLYGDTLLTSTESVGNYIFSSGAGYLFKHTDNGWIQQAKLSPSDGTDYDYFGGGSIALYEDIIVLIGACGASPKSVGGGGSIPGAVYVFTVDFDGDGIADGIDEDDDNDGYTDVQEKEVGTSPFNASDYPHPPGSPQNPQALEKDKKIDLSWEKPAETGSSSIIKYKIYRGTSSEDTSFLTDVATTSYIDTNVDNGEIYYYRVTAENMFGESNKSKEVNATPTASKTGKGNDNSNDGDSGGTPGFEAIILIVALFLTIILLRKKNL